MMPLIRYPTTVTFVDDDETFLRSLGGVMLQLRTDVLQTYYIRAEKALELFSNKNENELLHKCLDFNLSKSFGVENVSIKLSPLLREIYNQKRFFQPSVIFSDFDMPGINGLELFEKIQNKDIVKVLITGKMSSNIAVQAFNNGEINGFLGKSPKLIEEIDKLLTKSINDYFLSITKSLQNVFDNSNTAFTALNDPVFEHYFSNLLLNENIQEYYPIESPGTFLLIDKTGKAKVLWTKTKEEQFGLAELAEQEGLSRGTVSSIKAGTKTLSRPSSFECLKEENFIPCKQIKGSQGYCVAVSDDISSLGLDTNKILTFYQFKMQDPATFAVIY